MKNKFHRWMKYTVIFYQEKRAKCQGFFEVSFSLPPNILQETMFEPLQIGRLILRNSSSFRVFRPRTRTRNDAIFNHRLSIELSTFKLNFKFRMFLFNGKLDSNGLSSFQFENWEHCCTHCTVHKHMLPVYEEPTVYSLFIAHNT